MASRKKSVWQVDHAEWTFTADKYNTPVLTMDFTKSGESEARSHYLGALRFLENSHFLTNASGNHFDSQIQKPGNEVIELKGVYNIKRLAGLLKKRDPNETVDRLRASIPERLEGTGKDLPGDHYRPEADLFSNGEAPALTHVAKVVQSRAEVQGPTTYLHASNPDTGKHRTWIVSKETPPEVQQRIRESLARRAALPNSDKGFGR